MNNKVSAIVITFNEEKNIDECLSSISWADEIIVVDSQSTDKTVEITKSYTDKIYIREWEGYSAAKNFALSKVANDWVLAIDADERVTPELKNEIESILHNPGDKLSGYEIARKSYFLGKWIRHCGWYPGYVLRLFNKNMGEYSKANVHERFALKGDVGKLKSDLLHFTYDNLWQYFDKFNRYTTLAANDLNLKKKNFHFYQLIYRPFFTFFKLYILRLGFLDGIHGFIICFFSATYVFTKYAKLWEKSLFTQNKLVR